MTFQRSSVRKGMSLTRQYVIGKQQCAVLARANEAQQHALGADALVPALPQFSSFDPCVCATLRARQQRIPVLFLSTGGACWHVSPVRTSLNAAIAFAAQTGLQVRTLAETCGNL